VLAASVQAAVDTVTSMAMAINDFGI